MSETDMKQVTKFLSGVCLGAALVLEAALSTPSAMASGTPQEIAISVPAAFSAAITNATIITNTAAPFRPPQGVDTRLTLNVTGPGGGYITSNTVVGFNLAFDPGPNPYAGTPLGTNFTTGVPLKVTFTPDTNYAGGTVMSAYVAATNWTGVTSARFDYGQTMGTNTIAGLRLDWTP